MSQQKSASRWRAGKKEEFERKEKENAWRQRLEVQFSQLFSVQSQAAPTNSPIPAEVEIASRTQNKKTPTKREKPRGNEAEEYNTACLALKQIRYSCKLRGVASVACGTFGLLCSQVGRKKEIECFIVALRDKTKRMRLYYQNDCPLRHAISICALDTHRIALLVSSHSLGPGASRFDAIYELDPHTGQIYLLCYTGYTDLVAIASWNKNERKNSAECLSLRRNSTLLLVTIRKTPKSPCKVFPLLGPRPHGHAKWLAVSGSVLLIGVDTSIYYLSMQHRRLLRLSQNEFYPTTQVLSRNRVKAFFLPQLTSSDFSFSDFSRTTSSIQDSAPEVLPQEPPKNIFLEEDNDDDRPLSLMEIISISGIEHDEDLVTETERNEHDDDTSLLSQSTAAEAAAATAATTEEEEEKQEEILLEALPSRPSRPPPPPPLQRDEAPSVVSLLSTSSLQAPHTPEKAQSRTGPSSFTTDTPSSTPTSTPYMVSSLSTIPAARKSNSMTVDGPPSRPPSLRTTSIRSSSKESYLTALEAFDEHDLIEESPRKRLPLFYSTSNF